MTIHELTIDELADLLARLKTAAPLSRNIGGCHMTVGIDKQLYEDCIVLQNGVNGTGVVIEIGGGVAAI